MTEREAQEIVRMVESTWSADFGEAGRRVWRDVLEPFDAELGVAAVAKLAENPLPANRSKPQPSDLRSMCVILHRAEQDRERFQRRAIPRGRQFEPEWVKRWRRAHAAGETRHFPEQHEHVGVDAPFDDATVWVQPHEYLEPVEAPA